MTRDGMNYSGRIDSTEKNLRGSVAHLRLVGGNGYNESDAGTIVLRHIIFINRMGESIHFPRPESKRNAGYKSD
jgi:hypothetical protein